MTQSITPGAFQPVPMLDFSRQYALLREDILAAVTAVCDSQRFILGPEVALFETAAASVCRVPHAAGCASGTDALWLALAGAGIGPGDSVVTTPFSFFASVSAILRCGATPVLADIDPATFNLDPVAVAEFLEPPRAYPIRAILPVHLFGQCADWDAFQTLADRHALLLIEDAAQAFGAEWRGRPAGGLGASAAFSFYPTKNLAAMGDAGLVTTLSSAIDTRVRSLRAHGMTRRYFHDEVGWNCRLDTIQAAILSIKLRSVATGNARRRELAARYDTLFTEAGLIGKGIVLPVVDPRGTHVFHQYVIRAPRRNELRDFLTAHHIGSEVYYPLPLHLQASLQYLGYQAGDFPQAEQAAAEVLALPIYPELRQDEQETVVEAITAFFA